MEKLTAEAVAAPEVSKFWHPLRISCNLTTGVGRVPELDISVNLTGPFIICGIDRQQELGKAIAKLLDGFTLVKKEAKQ